MISFMNDYSEAAHERVLEKLALMAREQNAGYCLDDHCSRAAQLIKTAACREDMEVHFVTGGTQANMLVISAALRPYEAVIAADSGHINVHETGAVEGSGHKVLTAPHRDGKLTAGAVEEILWNHQDEHMVLPRMVYISDTTEWGTLYTYDELKALSDVCRKNGLYLFLDGARLGSALTAEKNELTLPDIARLTDAFTVGGTKNGALFGEAVVLTNSDLFPHFRYAIKNKGALLAKGFVCGAQFEALFEDGLYWKLAEHANRMAGLLTSVFRNAGIRFYTEPVSNQIFVILPGKAVDRLSEEVLFMPQMPCDGGVVCRFVTSWATKEEDVERLESLLWEALH